MTDIMDDIAEEISFQSYEDDLRLLFSLLNDVLHREIGSNIMQKVEHTRTLSQVDLIFLLNIVVRVFCMHVQRRNLNVVSGRAT